MPTLTLTEAQKLLTNLPPGVKIELRKKRTGEFELNNNGSIPETKDDIIKEKYPDLIGQPITISNAAKKYKVPRGTISYWIYSAKYIKFLDPNTYPQKLNEAEIAYLADIYRERRATGSKAPLLDEDGNPYQIKLPGLAAYRKRKNK